MRVSQVPCVWRSLSCSSCIQLAAASCTNVSKGAEYSDSKSFSFIILSSTPRCAGHNRASCSKSDPRSNMFCTGKSDNSETDTEVKPQCLCQVGLTCFYVGLSTLEGKSREGIYKEWKEKFPNTWAVSS